jgi:putative ABC transport system permease protein
VSRLFTRILLKFFRWFCHPDLQASIEGDLMELYDGRVAEIGKRKADLFLLRDVTLLFRPSIIKPVSGTYRMNAYGMLKNMFKISWRNALRQRQFTVLNVLGLTIGIAATIIIGLFVYQENTFDNFHINNAKIFRVNQSDIWGDWTDQISTTGPNVGTALKEDIPELEGVTRVLSLGDQTVKLEDSEGKWTSFRQKKFYAIEENFFQFFSFPFVVKTDENMLVEPFSMILTESSLKKYFGKEIEPADALEQVVEVKDWDGTWQTFIVRGVVKDSPQNSHMDFDILVSLESYDELMEIHGWKWIWNAFTTYVMIQDDVNMAYLHEKIQELPAKWAAPTTERIFNQTVEEFTGGFPWKLALQPLDEIHTSGFPANQLGPTGNPLFIKIFAAIGLLVLILSAINFMNLSTAKSTRRSKEVGIRKVMGSQRHLIFSQFILESIMYVFFSAVLAIVLVTFVLPYFNSLTDSDLEFVSYLSNPQFYLMGILFVLVLGFLSGSYPAIYLSSFQPIQSLKGVTGNKLKGNFIRNGLVVFQFTISIALIVCTIFVQKQVSYASNLDVGFAKDNILQIHNIEQMGFDTEVLKSKLSSNPAFSEVAKSFGIPPNVFSGDRYKTLKDDNVVQLRNIRVDDDYLNLLGLDFVAGRNFDKQITTDKYKVIINVEAVKLLGWSLNGDQSPIGQNIKMASGDENAFEVIGVVQDFNFNSLKEGILPLIIIHHLNDEVWDYGFGLSYYSMRLNPSSVSSGSELRAIIEEVKNDIHSIDASIPFEYSFMDQEFDKTFRFEQNAAVQMNIFTLMAMVIACLGLFGLAAFSAEQRTKELGIRKVLGAKVFQIVVNFSSEFAKLILVSSLIACPLAYFLVRSWLSDFEYQTPIDLLVFILTAAGALTIALLTISFQSVSLANQNPVKALRSE